MIYLADLFETSRYCIINITKMRGLFNFWRRQLWLKQPEFKKYLPLEAWFRDQPASLKHIELTFDQVEKILGNPLPASAIKLKTWWTNFLPKVQSHRTAWLNNGWKVTEFDQQARWVRFDRV